VDRRLSTPPALLLVGSVLSVQIGAALATAVLRSTGVSGLVVLRLGFAAVLLVVLLRPRISQLREIGLWRVGLLGVVVALDNWLFYAALQRLAMGATVTLAFLGPLLLAALTAPGWWSIKCAVVSAGGIALLTSGLGARPLLGALLAASSGAVIAGYVVMARSVARRSTDGGPLAVAMAAGAVATAPLLAFDGLPAFRVRVLLVGMAIAVVASALPYWLEFRAARRLTADTFALLLCLEPAVAATLGWAVLHQRLGIAQLVGVALVVAGGAGAATGPWFRPGRHRRAAAWSRRWRATKAADDPADPYCDRRHVQRTAAVVRGSAEERR
jgi:inner membrane transporter RhtA